MEKGEGDKLEYLSNVFITLPAETKDSVLKKARILLRIQGSDESPIQEEKKGEQKAD